MTHMYAAALVLHSWFRWAVILTGLIAFVRAAAGASGTKAWTPADDRAGFHFTIALDVQILIGLALYSFLSPLTAQVMHDFGAAMKDPHLRFWAVEHAFGMVIGVALAHIGRARARKADSLRRHRVAAIFFGLALLAIVASIPWPGTPNGRPWVRW
ncbi:MAG: hypothetical protein ABI818_07230 [Acidobacteriota bacterium]